MPAYPTRIYTNTGFDRGNVPGTEAALPATGFLELEAVYKWQDRYNAEIRVKATWDQIKDADYLRIGTPPSAAYYVVTSVRMLNPQTAALMLTADPLMTAGGLSALNVAGGQVERAHAGTDDLFGNIIPEPWTPSQRLEILEKETISQGGGVEAGDNRNLVVCTCDLTKAQEYEAIAAAAAGDAGSVIFPKIPSMQGKSPTYFTVKIDESRGALYDMPNMWVFSLGTRTSPDQDAIDNVAALRSMGIESAIVNSYVLPGGSIGSITEDQGYVKNIIGHYQEWPSGFNYEYAQGVKNKKVFALFNRFTAVSIVSGNSAEFEAHDLYNNDAAPVFIMKADPAPGGTVYLMPKYYQGAPCLYYEQAVAGLPWLTAGVMYEGASGGALTLANAQRRNEVERVNNEYANLRADVSNARATVDTAGGLVKSAFTGDVGGAVSSLYTGANRIIDTEISRSLTNYNSAVRMGDNLFSAAQITENVAPVLAFPMAINASSYFGNAFSVYHTVLSDADVQRFDRFLTMYGYAQDKPLERSDLTNRQNYNYIKTRGALVTATGASMRENQDIADMLDAGVRIWHVTPSAAAMADNPIREGS